MDGAAEVLFEGGEDWGCLEQKRNINKAVGRGGVGMCGISETNPQGATAVQVGLATGCEAPIGQEKNTKHLNSINWATAKNDWQNSVAEKKKTSRAEKTMGPPASPGAEKPSRKKTGGKRKEKRDPIVTRTDVSGNKKRERESKKKKNGGFRENAPGSGWPMTQLLTKNVEISPI